MVSDADVGARIRKARLQAGYASGTAFATALGISQSALSRIETGERRVTATELGAIAALLRRPAQELIEQVPSLVFYRRDSGGELDEAAQHAFDWLREFSDRFRVLRESTPQLELPKPYSVSVEPPTTMEVAQAAAYEVRQFLGLGTGPAPDMFTVLERVGCAVVVRDTYPRQSFEAIYVPKPAGIVLLNGSEKPGVRQRFTLAHELAHHLFDSSGVVVDSQDLLGTSWNSDRIANAFAAHFLMPRHGIEIEMVRRFATARPSEATHAYWLAYSFGVSLEALCYQLTNLGLVQTRTAGQWRRADRRVLTGMLDLVANQQYAAVTSRWPPELIQRLGYLLREGVLDTDQVAEHLDRDSEVAARIADEVGSGSARAAASEGSRAG